MGLAPMAGRASRLRVCRLGKHGLSAIQQTPLNRAMANLAVIVEAGTAMNVADISQAEPSTSRVVPTPVPPKMRPTPAVVKVELRMYRLKRRNSRPRSAE